ncbi:FG-GAP-like repeat-containing protein [Myxococcus sp. RHSTA-1-4]|uniref:FG-GAP-like repeat-containing protein n=1 Tax=Myxococcus sp. RHSTA-1-4 TaxID=2874601 RepID=UPI001CBBE88E|nr:FG-GAP-like repeat-containing protein [Myxococcus sp. RHSTA-1-4]MBZ4422454.1 FG-GAP-like repeat-containing protein [Myxococcus sp. RHSTA-1-4]
MRLHGFVLGGLLLVGCGGSDTSTGVKEQDTLSTGLTFEEFKARTYQEPDTGIYIVEGDLPVIGEEALREYYSRNVQPGALLLHTRNGIDAAWNSQQALDLTYCVSKGAFGGNHAKISEAMNRAAVAWENVAHVSFIHSSDHDTNCTSTNTGVLFDVRTGPDNAPYKARAFLPGYARSSRELLIHPAYVNMPMADMAGMLTHELGHVLGFRHEHIRIPQSSGDCNESSDWRELTPYDSGSAMHYTTEYCAGSTNPGPYRLSGWDGWGAASKYSRGPQTVAGDFDGNGFEDLLIYRPGSNQAWVGWSDGWGGWLRSTSIFGAGFDFWSMADRVVVLDFNNDQRDDFLFYRPGGGPAFAVRSNADRTFTTTMAAYSFAGFDFGEPQDRALAFDYNADGFDDLFFYRPGNRVAWVARSNGDGTFSNAFASFAGIGTFDLADVRDQALAFDYNNDGRDDLFFYRPGGRLANVVRSDPGDVFTSVVSTTNFAGFDFSDPRDRALAFEHDGDNLDDIFMYRPGGSLARIAKSTSTGFSAAYMGAWGIGGYDLFDFRDQALALDYDADNKDDLFLFRPGALAAYVLKSNGSGSFTTVHSGHGFAPPYPFDFAQHQDKAVIFDYNNDGRDDFYLYRYDTQRVVASVSNGTFASFPPNAALNPY